MCHLYFWARISLSSSWRLMLIYRPSSQLTLRVGFQNICEAFYICIKLLNYFCLLYLKTCLGIIYKCAPIGVFFCFEELIQREPEIWLSLRLRTRLKEGSNTWSKFGMGSWCILGFFVEQIGICLIPIGLELFQTEIVELKLNHLGWCQTVKHKIFTFLNCISFQSKLKTWLSCMPASFYNEIL